MNMIPIPVLILSSIGFFVCLAVVGYSSGWIISKIILRWTYSDIKKWDARKLNNLRIDIDNELYERDQDE